MIFINMRSAIRAQADFDSKIPTLALPTSEDKKQFTQIYYWNGQQRYFRDGKWVLYLTKLTKEVDAENQEWLKLRYENIDDLELFADTELEEN